MLKDIERYKMALEELELSRTILDGHKIVLNKEIEEDSKYREELLDITHCSDRLDKLLSQELNEVNKKLKINRSRLNKISRYI